MTLENARVLRKHRLELGKKVDDIDKLYPELAKEVEEVKVEEAPEVKEKPKDYGKKPKGRTN